MMCYLRQIKVTSLRQHDSSAPPVVFVSERSPVWQILVSHCPMTSMTDVTLNWLWVCSVKINFDDSSFKSALIKYLLAYLI